MRDKLRIAIDMDEVLADTIGKFITIYEQRHNTKIGINDFPGKEFNEVLPEEIRHTLREYINEPGFFRDIPVMEGAIPVVQQLHEKYDVYIVSAAMEFKYSMTAKLEWLNEHFPFISWTNIVFCGHKIVDVDIMIDDRVKNFINFGGRKILFTSPHNLAVCDYERVNTWEEVGKLLL
ncbi:5' nucleotidase, NT5C type [Mucilaginibacter limnophilus]|nr:5'(3')-deoxyribonucleotidase [Mucilaginibacter limnophilus]